VDRERRRALDLALQGNAKKTARIIQNGFCYGPIIKTIVGECGTEILTRVIAKYNETEWAYWFLRFWSEGLTKRERSKLVEVIVRTKSERFAHWTLRDVPHVSTATVDKEQYDALVSLSQQNKEENNFSMLSMSGSFWIH
jgi:hypothetical protein